MTWTNVDDMTLASFAAIITNAHESVGSNTGTPIQLAIKTKPETGTGSWEGADPHESVKNNKFDILQDALDALQDVNTYAGKELDLSGIYLEETVV